MAKSLSVLLGVALLQVITINASRANVQSSTDTLGHTEIPLYQEITECYADMPWSGLKKINNEHVLTSNYAAEVAARMNNPRLVRQKNQMFCGPAAFLHLLAMARPDTYERMASSLFCTGKYTHPTSGYFIDVSAATFAEYFGASSVLGYEFASSSSHSCRGSRANCLDPSDWIMEAALLQKVNTWNSPTSDSQTSQLTFPGEMKEWIEKLMPDAEVRQYGSVTTYLLGAVSTYDKTVPQDLWERMLTVVNTANGQAPAILLTEWSTPGLPQHYVVLVKVDNDQKDCWIKTYGKYQMEDCYTLNQKTFIAFVADFQNTLAVPQRSVAQMRRDLRDTDKTVTSTPHWKTIPAEDRPEADRHK